MVDNFRIETSYPKFEKQKDTFYFKNVSVKFVNLINLKIYDLTLPNDS